MFVTSSVAGPVLGGFFAEHLHWSIETIELAQELAELQPLPQLQQAIPSIELKQTTQAGQGAQGAALVYSLQGEGQPLGLSPRTGSEALALLPQSSGSALITTLRSARPRKPLASMQLLVSCGTL